MFKKIEINNVGRFKSAKTTGDEQFLTKNTYIFGRNTFGKSTLTAIFRSLKENCPDYLIGRKTIGTQKQVVKIIPEVTTPIGEFRYSTDEGRWSAPFGDIIIFDTQFIRESVYTQTQQIGPEQQRSIESFMLGSEGAKYNILIDELNEKIKINTATQTSINGEYGMSKHLLGGFSFDEFLALVEVKNSDIEIEKIQRDINTIENAELISRKLSTIINLLKSFSDYDITGISEKLSVNSNLIAQHFDSHVDHTQGKQSYATFLQEGSRLRLKGDNERCPFCTQKVTDSTAKEFLETIDLIYNEKYRELLQAIKDGQQLFSKQNFVAQIDGAKKDIQQSGYELTINFMEFETGLEECERSIEKKKEDLAEEFSSTAVENVRKEAINLIAQIHVELEKFQNPVDRKIELSKTLDRLRANRERFTSWKDRCDRYLQAKEDSQSLSGEKKKLWDEYKRYANTLSATMLDDINAVLLDAANADFKVQQFNFKGNQRQDLLVLAMGNNQISNDGQDNEMTIKNCLSDSDKLLLALAFFLATVKNDPAIKVVVMDDPVSSFDVDRKRIIAKEIQRVLASTEKQLILLTHEKGFYHLLHSENRDGNAVFLKISFDSQLGSDLVVCNPDEDFEFMSDYNRWIANMKNAETSHELSDVLNAHAHIRPVIEHVLKLKYPLELTAGINRVGEMLIKLEEPDGSYSVNSQKDSIDKILTNVPHHDNSGNGQYPVVQLGIDDYKKDIRDAFDVIKLL